MLWGLSVVCECRADAIHAHKRMLALACLALHVWNSSSAAVRISYSICSWAAQHSWIRPWQSGAFMVDRWHAGAAGKEWIGDGRIAAGFQPQHQPPSCRQLRVRAAAGRQRGAVPAQSQVKKLSCGIMRCQMHEPSSTCLARRQHSASTSA